MAGRRSSEVGRCSQVTEERRGKGTENGKRRCVRQKVEEEEKSAEFCFSCVLFKHFTFSLDIK